jgi:histidinol-phosphate aminotransferase
MSGLVYAKIEGRDAKMALDMNESLCGLPEADRDALADLDTGRFERYPEYGELVAAAAEGLGLGPEWLRPTAGADEGISVTVQAWLGKGTRVAVPDPVFTMYDVRAAAMGASFSRVSLDDSFRLDPEAFIEAARGCDLAVIVNPGNPAGKALSADEVEGICAALAPMPVAVDEAYADFPGITVMPRLERMPNAVVLRSMSKSYAIAGLRVGFIAGNPAILEELDPFILPYGISRPSAKVALALLKKKELPGRVVETVLEARRRTAAMLRKYFVRVDESDANFVLAKVGPAAPLLRDAMALRGLLAKAWGSGRMAGWLRMSACPREWEERAEKALIESLREVDALKEGRPA